VKLYDKYDKKLEIYGVNLTYYDKQEDVQAFVKEFHIDFPVLLDPKGEVATTYKVQAIPTTYFVNGDGKVVDVVLGLVDTKTLEKKFKDLALDKY
jgi:cytochrome c biogenesis protein CcmG/thiol:disulfide interchange protein DsbE